MQVPVPKIHKLSTAVEATPYICLYNRRVCSWDVAIGLTHCASSRSEQKSDINYVFGKEGQRNWKDTTPRDLPRTRTRAFQRWIDSGPKSTVSKLRRGWLHVQKPSIVFKPPTYWRTVGVQVRIRHRFSFGPLSVWQWSSSCYLSVSTILQYSWISAVLFRCLNLASPRKRRSLYQKNFGASVQ
jgi:hypothetical protein